VYKLYSVKFIYQGIINFEIMLFKNLLLFSSLLLSLPLFAQDKAALLDNAVKKLLNDKDLKYASFSITVLDATTGNEVYTYQPNLAMPAASTQKVITAIAAYDVLGFNYKYNTNFYLRNNTTGAPTLLVKGSFDPTLGSYRYKNTKPDLILEQLKLQLAKQKINSALKIKCATNVVANYVNSTSDAWIWEDMGNYYGAPCSPLMWRENSYDLYMDASNGKSVNITSTSPAWLNSMLQIENSVQVGPAGSGDEACIYKFPFGDKAIAAGSIGSNETKLEVSGSTQGERFFWYNLHNYINDKDDVKKMAPLTYTNNFDKASLLYQHTSPSLDSIVYWFLKKSVNLYGEALLRTMAVQQYKKADYQFGVKAIHQFANKIGVDSAALHLFDGCGLSPQNRITTKALANFMQYARGQRYYKQLYTSLPVINDISMKSGSIHGVRAYTGYVSSSDNNIYTFAINVNNYTCNGKEAQAKLWKVLDVLK
jgi:serine-type D-Ala-D-Ala carboxypeptidase/endopeptidase (penicillin-binding protein 4)